MFAFFPSALLELQQHTERDPLRRHRARPHRGDQPPQEADAGMLEKTCVRHRDRSRGAPLAEELEDPWLVDEDILQALHVPQQRVGVEEPPPRQQRLSGGRPPRAVPGVAGRYRQEVVVRRAEDLAAPELLRERDDRGGLGEVLVEGLVVLAPCLFRAEIGCCKFVLDGLYLGLEEVPFLQGCRPV